MNINCPKHIDNLYSAFKKAYNFDIKQCIIKESHCDNFKAVGRLLTNDGFFGWDFVMDYFNNCNKCFKLTYKTIVFNILIKGNLSKAKR